jgi:hypothetical protein
VDDGSGDRSQRAGERVEIAWRQPGLGTPCEFVGACFDAVLYRTAGVGQVPGGVHVPGGSKFSKHVFPLAIAEVARGDVHALGHPYRQRLQDMRLPAGDAEIEQRRDVAVAAVFAQQRRSGRPGGQRDRGEMRRVTAPAVLERVSPSAYKAALGTKDMPILAAVGVAVADRWIRACSGQTRAARAKRNPQCRHMQYTERDQGDAAE